MVDALGSNQASAPITATAGRYIKLGPKGRWEELCLADGTIRIGFYELPHDLGVNADKEAIKSVYRARGKTSGASRNYAGQFLDFYHLDEKTLRVA